MPEMHDFNTQIIEEFRANGGKIGGQFEGAPMLLLTTVGAKSGLTRVNPMMYLAEGERLFVFASKAGAPTNPDWFHNAVANPIVAVEVGSDRFDAVATVLEGGERDRVYAEQAERYPGFGEYQEATDRVIPVVALDRR
ncbi:MAG: nitroreductase family deazaflavin-dependent oxidoreductase [Acidimicrobiales bacterium]|jgi:deazaflavin-dependent oxidoreductase (nitroreductase family)